MERGSGPGLSPSNRRLRRLERTCFAIGALLLALFASARLHSAVSRGFELASFDQAKVALASAASEIPLDQSLWAEGRITKYEESLRQATAPPLAVLRIPRLGIVVPVLPGVDELTLNRAVGAIPGTAAPGEPGNVGIAGHRDGFFRGLKDIAAGDRLELETLTGRQEYQVTSIRIVDPAAVEVLAPTAQPALTLVTCYPFYFVGNAPQRFIVRAEALSPVSAAEGGQNR
jgi:sortase A